MENTHLVFYPEASEFSKNTYEFEKMGIRLAGCIDEVRWKYRYNALECIDRIRWIYTSSKQPLQASLAGACRKKYYCTNS